MKYFLFVVAALSGCGSGVVTIERPIPANMLAECAASLPVAADGNAGTILRISAARASMYAECRDTHNSLVKFLKETK